MVKVRTAISGTGNTNLPFAMKLKAWWNGYDPRHYAVLRDAVGGDDDFDPAGPADAVDEGRIVFRGHSVEEGWPKARIELNELMWGKGHVTPGGDDYVKDLIVALGLSEENSVVELGAGLGGVSRYITRMTGAWVTGYEPDPVLAKEAMNRSNMAGLGKKAVIDHSPLLGIKTRKGTVNCVIAKETLFCVEDKRALFEIVRNMLQHEGQFLMTDFYARDPDNPDPAGRTWAQYEIVPVHLWSLDATTRCLEELGFEVRIREDISVDYRKRVVKRFKTLVDTIRDNETDVEQVSWAMAEGEYWARRVAMLEQGEVTVHRVYARVPLG